MNNLKYTLLGLLSLVAFFLSVYLLNSEKPSDQKSEKTIAFPHDWFYRQRAYPHGQINHAAYYEAKREQQALQNNLQFRNNNEWELCGPLNTGGRIVDVAIHPSNIDIIYAGAASGGIFKSTDKGENWTPIFEDALSLSIGDMALAPSAPNVLYVGTGEANAGGGSLAYDGFGMYKSLDAGANWMHLGLEDVGSIGKVEVDPGNPDRVFVAAMGDLFGENPERGIYRTTDGGDTWSQVLSVSDSTGAIDLAIHPHNPDTVYAALWERVRRPNRRSYGGPTSGIYRSYDGGDNWTPLSIGLPTQDKGRIGIAISPSQPNILWAMITDHIGNLISMYKSTDNGDTWTDEGSAGLLATSYMWWFGRVFIHPTDPGTVYATSLEIHRTTTDGQFWGGIFPGVHVDQHAMYIDPNDPDFIVIGNDGGLYTSDDGGLNWEHKNTMPITQFYTCEVDYSHPERLYGGTQDNGSIRTVTGNLDDWTQILGGDGFVCLVDPTDNNYVYAESQYGNFKRSTNGGQNFMNGLSGIMGTDLRNWNTPVIFNPLNPKSLYLGTTRLYKTTNRANSWSSISPVFSIPPSNTNLVFGTITTISVSPVDTNIIYIGTDDGSVWNTTDGGQNWENRSSSLPDHWVTKVATDPLDPHKAYVTFSGYRYYSYLPHVFKTLDSGDSWEDISSDLPEVPVNDIEIDPEFNRLYLATDVGVFLSSNEGSNWELFGLNLPKVPVTDLCIHPPTQTLIAGTYGRSMHKISLLTTDAPDQDIRPRLSAKAFPNPFQKQSRIEIELEQPEKVEISIHNASGKLVQQLYQGRLSAGIHGFDFQANNFTAGIYVCRIKAGRQLESLVLNKV